MIAEIIIDSKCKEIDRVFCYTLDQETKGFVQGVGLLGTRVLVPFGRANKIYEGIIVGLFNNHEEFDAHNILDQRFQATTANKSDRTVNRLSESLKPVKALLGESVLTEEMLQLAQWMKEKYYSTLSECLKCIIPSGMCSRADLSVYERRVFLLNDTDLQQNSVLKLNPVQKQILSLLESGDKSVQEIRSALNISESPIQTLAKKNLVTVRKVAVRRETITKSEGTDDRKILTMAQEAVLEKIRNAKKPVLLHGVTGSGKTEIYMHLIEEAVAQGKQAIMMVPEISLTPQTVRIFSERFQNQVTVTHSRLTQGERYDQWKRAKDGEISIMIGPRSAIFTPFNRLGIIILDEEHEHSYKSEVTPKYLTKELAIKRAELSDAKVVLGSATPSVESYFEAEQGLYELVCLKERINKQLPQVSIKDMRVELDIGNKSIFSQELYEQVVLNLEKKEQTILFLNRRGYANFVSCRKCGLVMKCDSCSVSLTEHRAGPEKNLVCHYCGKALAHPKNCPTCGSVYIRNFGIGTQRVEEDTKRLFPTARVLRMDMDTTAGKHSHENILESFRQGEADILVGTQMIAKGLDFPRVSLVGIIAADIGLNAGDFRSGENTFRLCTQVAGRAGRAAVLGRVYIQTYNPYHYSLLFAKDNNYEDFYRHEITLRRECNYPPFSHIFVVLFSIDGSNELPGPGGSTGAERRLIELLFKLLQLMKFYNRKGLFEILGPAPALISRLNNHYRWKLIVKAQEEERLKNFVLYCYGKLKEKERLEGVSVNLSLDPMLIL